MTGDHINKYLFNETLPYLFEGGRISMPLFILVLAYNLARPSCSTNGAYQRTALRLGAFGLLSSIPFIKLGCLLNGWYPLNILFTLQVITVVTGLIDRAKTGSIWAGLGAVAVFLVGGGLVEFWWLAVTLGVGAWYYFRFNSLPGLLISMSACASLWCINGNYWALAAFPILFALSLVDIQVPRLRWAFYWYYPAHLAAIFLIRIPMSKAGYHFL
ncbi:hypothetical protein ABW20_dc0100845 [Dactylellina cionopaga]|nr:hypothetical protein ABW20_dc0100845 [Dactylellina cionopaga]